MPEKRIAMIPVDKNVAVNRRRIACTLQIFVFVALTNAKAYEAVSGVSITIVIHTGFTPLVILNTRSSSIGHLQARINPCYVMFSYRSEGNKKPILECFSCFSLS